MTTQMPQINKTDKFGVTDASKILGVAPKTIYRWIEAKAIKHHIRRNGRIFFFGEDLLKAWKLN